MSGVLMPTSWCRAIALSLQDHGDAREVIDLQSGNEDEEEAEFQRQLQLALEASKAEASHTTATPAMKEPSPAHIANPVNSRTPSSSNATASVAQTNSVASGAVDWRAERAQLERERLARQAKLLQQQGGSKSSSSGTRRNSPEDSDDDDEDVRPAKRPNLGKAAAPSNTRDSDQVFLDGEIRQTANQFAQPRADGKPAFRLTEILGNVSCCKASLWFGTHRFPEARFGLCYHIFVFFGYIVDIWLFRP